MIQLLEWAVLASAEQVLALLVRATLVLM